MQEEPETVQPDTLNYYNYFTEVEDEFVRRRGSHLMISSIDWSLVETWKNAGIPLHVVLRGINQSFDSYDARGRTYRKVNSVLYCQQAVEEAFAEYQLAQVGASQSEAEGSAERPTGFDRAALLDFIDRCSEDLEQVAPRMTIVNPAQPIALVREALDRASNRLAEIRLDVDSSVTVDVESLERDLDSLDRILLESIRASCADEAMEALKKEAKAQLRGFRKTMDKAMYNQTIDNFVARRLREVYCLPRLSLFYM